MFRHGQWHAYAAWKEWKAAPLLTVDTLGMDGLGFAPLSSDPKFLKISQASII